MKQQGGHFELYGTLFKEKERNAFVSLAMAAVAEKRLDNLANPARGFGDAEDESGDKHRGGGRAAQEEKS